MPTPVFVQKYFSIAGQKLWDDQDDRNGIRPDAVTVRLVRNGTIVSEVSVTAEDGWQYLFDNLPFYDEQGKPYIYTLSEQPVPGYFARMNGYDLINTLLMDELPPEDIPLKKDLGENELAQQLYLPGYEIPLYGSLLKTGLELPAYPFVFAGIGCAAIIALLVIKRRKRKDRD